MRPQSCWTTGEAVANAADAVDKAILKLELEVVGSDQYGLEKAYALVDHMNKGKATFRDVLNFAKSLAGTLGAAPTPDSPTQA